MQSYRNVKHWGRNAKILVATEAFFGIPMSWVFFYRTIFIRSLGLNEVFIGFSVTLPLMFQMILPMVGGYLADRFGRKRVMLSFDSIGWIGALSMWLIAREPIHILAAMLFQGLTTTIYGVWETLLVEDTEPAYRVGIYSFLQLVYIFGGILTPVSGVIISLYGIERGCRFMFLIALVSIASMLVIRLMKLRESKIGEMLLSFDGGVSQRSEGYLNTLKMVTKNRRFLMVFILSVSGGLLYPLLDTYRPLYLSDSKALALDESIVSIIPMASSIPSLLALVLIVPRLDARTFRKALLSSYSCGLLGIIILIMAPKGALALAVLSAILESARFVAMFSILRVFLVNAIDEVDAFARAKIMSLTITFSALVSWPMPAIGGYLYSANPILPFVLSALFIVLSICLMLRI